MTTPEHIAMLNGRMAALQAATADLFERGALRSRGAHDIVVGPAVPGMTDLQRAIHRAVANRALHLDREPDVIAQLDLLQRDCVRRGLLRPPRRPIQAADIIAPLVGAGVACWMLTLIGAPRTMLFVVVAIPVALVAGGVLRAREGKDRRTKAGIEALHQARDTMSTSAPLGAQVGAFGTRPLMIAFPAAALLGWSITDFEDPHVQAQRMLGTGSGGSCASWTGGSNAWCSGGNTCGSGGNCNSGSCSSGSCSSGSCSSGGCGGGSSCGGGGGCSS